MIIAIASTLLLDGIGNWVLLAVAALIGARSASSARAR